MIDDDHKSHLETYCALVRYDNKRIAIAFISFIVIAVIVVILCRPLFPF